ncbi:MAG: acyl-homoserine-lactone synthase [Planktomarina sp.]
MIHFLYADQLNDYPELRDSMFRDRATQFKERMGWDVSVDENGFEQDQYDVLCPLYVIAADENGRHMGSMRLLPTTGRTMVNEHFTNVIGGGTVVSPFIWECTRFCLGTGGKPATAALLMLAGGQVLKGLDITSFVGVFDAPMLRIYSAIGSSPDILGTQDDISVGLWNFTDDAQAKIARRARTTPEQVTTWFERDFQQNGMAQSA